MEEIKRQPMNIIFPLREGEIKEVLLGIKTRKIGVAKWNGWGGKVRWYETVGWAAKRELKKESGLIAKARHFRKVAVIDFYIHKSEDKVVLNSCDILVVNEFKGAERESEEMANPTWFPVDKLPLHQMMKDAPLWVPRVLNGENIHAIIHYDKDRKNILGSVHTEQLDLGKN